MCGRYAITLPPEAIRQLFQTHGELPNWPACYNAAPTTALPVVRQGTATEKSSFADESAIVTPSRLVSVLTNNAPAPPSRSSRGAQPARPGLSISTELGPRIGMQRGL
jgi:putative SOS response-associated peptidase YedK